jgi:toxin-antitoxin system PIN domain toxin
MIAVDTNLLIYAHRSGTAEHSAARKALEQAMLDPDGWGISVACLAEFWSIVTHPACPGRPSTPQEAERFIAVLLNDGGAMVWLPELGFAERLAGTAARLNISGPRIFDLQIALLAYEHQARVIWTHDSHFQTVPGLRVEDPLL